MKTSFGVQYHSSRKYSGLVIAYRYDPQEDDVEILGVTARSDEVELLNFFEMPYLLENLRYECWEEGRDEYQFSEAA